MDRRILFGVLAIVITLSIIGLLLNLPTKPIGCISNDGSCPSGCKFENDRDCTRSTVTTSGEVRRFLSYLDCVIVKPICGNSRCDFNDVDCEMQCACETTVNKDYKNVFESAKVKCTARKDCVACPEPQSRVVCISG